MDLYSLISLVSLVAAILNVILFFKIWGMTNDVKRLADKICGDDSQKTEDDETLNFKGVKEVKYSVTSDSLMP